MTMPSSSKADGRSSTGHPETLIHAVLELSTTAIPNSYSLHQAEVVPDSAEMTRTHKVNVDSNGKSTGSSLAPEPSDSKLITHSTSAITDMDAGSGYSSGLGLTRQPQLLNKIAVEYPASAGSQVGRLVLRVLVSEVGFVDGVSVVKADPPEVFDSAALEAFAHTRIFTGPNSRHACKKPVLCRN